MKSFAVFLLVIGVASSQHIGLGSPAMKGSHPSSLKSNLPSATELSSSRARVPLRNYVPLVGEEVYGKQHNDATGGEACCTKDCECNGVASCCAKVQMVKAVQVQRGTLPNHTATPSQRPTLVANDVKCAVNCTKEPAQISNSPLYPREERSDVVVNNKVEVLNRRTPVDQCSCCYHATTDTAVKCECCGDQYSPLIGK